MDEYYTKHGKMIICTQEGNLRRQSYMDQENNDIPLQILRSNITLCTGNTRNLVISISYAQEMNMRYSLSRGPIIAISHILPEDGYVFSVMENGDLDVLKQMLDKGEVFLNSRDSEGRCLLNV